MGRAFQTDRDVLGETESTADLVLGAPALLGIFFAAALLCAVCFGFGYSSGHTVRRTPLVESDETASATQPPATVNREASRTAMAAPDAGRNAAPTQDASAGTEPGFPPPQTAPPAAHKPTPGAAYVSPDTNAPDIDTSNSAPSKTQDLPASRGASTQPQYAVPRHAASVAPGDTTAPAPNAVAPVPVAPRVVVPAADTATPASGPALNVMVQIAAVSHAADAQTLASALRHDGFAAIVRTTTGDPFFHVQVGPFPTLQAAKAMRARLAGNGYNAFIRP